MHPGSIREAKLGAVSGQSQPARKPLAERIRAGRKRHEQRPLAYRIVFAVAGFLVALLGLALIPLPGPGWLLVVAGVTMLALEFEPAERLLAIILRRFDRVNERAAQASHVQKALFMAATALGGLAAVGAVLVWEIPYFPG